jgi:hypothetical protein
MALLGHTFGDTHESYEHVELPLKRDAIRKLETWLQSEPTTGKEETSFAPENIHGSWPASGGPAHSEDARRLASSSDSRIRQPLLRDEIQ